MLFFGQQKKFETVSIDEHNKEIIRVHESMVAYYTKALCQTLGINPEKPTKAAVYHDHHKYTWYKGLFIKKHDELTEEDINVIRKHPRGAGEIIFEEMPLDKYVFISGDPSIIDLILLHHEYPDGTGYYGYKDLPIESVIISISDIFDACVSDRNYRPGLPKEEALNEALKKYEKYLTKKHFDVEVIKKTLLDNLIKLQINDGEKK